MHDSDIEGVLREHGVLDNLDQWQIANLVEELEQAIPDDDDGYDNGYGQGYEEGYEGGYEGGYEEGYEEGYEDGTAK